MATVAAINIKFPLGWSLHQWYFWMDGCLMRHSFCYNLHKTIKNILLFIVCVMGFVCVFFCYCCFLGSVFIFIFFIFKIPLFLHLVWLWLSQCSKYCLLVLTSQSFCTHENVTIQEWNKVCHNQHYDNKLDTQTLISQTRSYVYCIIICHLKKEYTTLEIKLVMSL